MSAPAAALPRWDMSVPWPAVDSPELAEEMAGALADIDALADRAEALGVGAGPPLEVDAAVVAAFEEVSERLDATLERVETLSAYLAGYVTTDSRDQAAQARFSELRQRRVRLSAAWSRYVAWIGRLDLGALRARSRLAEELAGPLEAVQEEARHLMGPGEEDLAAELSPSGAGAWTRLHGDLTSQLAVRVEEPGGGVRELPMSSARNLARHPDRDVRTRAHEAELRTWQGAALPLAAALNGVKGQALVLATRRGWESPLDEALHGSRIDRGVLDAMMGAVREAFPALRGYLRAKAAALGLPALAWYDRSAPLQAGGGEARRWDWDDGAAFVARQFGSYSDALRDLAERALRDRWIDAEPRPGKRDGGFCMRLRGGESRILVNYEPSYMGVAVVAHELGHAYHNQRLAGLGPLRRRTPMTLAETASTFCEQIVQRAALDEADPDEQLVILEGSLQRDCAVVIDIASRFRFEERLFAARRERDLSADEICELMVEAQRWAYGDGLDPDALHPYEWAAKPHYYSWSFYNYPYTFGLLFGLGLYAGHREDPDGFGAEYDALLASTGMADARTLAARVGIDLGEAAFWRAGLDLVRADVDRFVGLVAGS